LLISAFVAQKKSAPLKCGALFLPIADFQMQKNLIRKAGIQEMERHNSKGRRGERRSSGSDGVSKQ
jgi:hypothetical protein